MQPLLPRLALALGIATLLACSSSSTNEASVCQSGDLKLCTCTDGAQGQRSCQANGSFGECVCGGTGGSGGSGGTVDGGGSAGMSGSAGSGGGTGGGTSSACKGSSASSPPSCAGLTDCSGGVSCCESVCLEGGTYNRDNNASAEATVSPFRLDLFEVTVGRFRQFALSNAPAPSAGSGKHAHLSGGGIAGETGWQAAWDKNVPVDKTGWDTALLKCAQDAPGSKPTWTTQQGGNDALPINCVSWYHAYAFCIWDGGFLPTEAEFGFAYVNGKQQLTYPWGSTKPTSDVAVFADVNGPLAVGSKPKSVSGVHDLAGNVFEYLLDDFASGYPVSPCTDCVHVGPSGVHVIRGGGWLLDEDALAASYRLDFEWGGQNVGFRCARSP